MGRRNACRVLPEKSRFASREELAQVYWRSKAFNPARLGVIDLLARATLGPVVNGTGFELCC